MTFAIEKLALLTSKADSTVCNSVRHFLSLKLFEANKY
jgi:hypothetical protein